jgi:hypothetical protein
MALPTQNWRMLQPVYVGPTGSATTGGIAGVLDAIYTMGTATVYADNTARTPGTGSAWTWFKDNTTFATGATTACYATPPTTTAINQQIIFAGTTSVAGAVWKQLYDSRLVSYLYAGIGKNTGAYTSWNNATTPFTAGDFTGFATGGSTVAISNAVGYIVYMVECQESVIVYVNSVTAASLTAAFVVGAYIDPLSSAALNAESDGRLYGVTTPGSQGRLASNWLSILPTSGVAGTLFANSTTASQAHSVVFTPGAGTVTTASRLFDSAPSVAFVSRNGDLPQIPLQMATAAAGQFLGQLRQMFITRDSSSMSALESGGTVKGYALGGPLGSSNVLICTY